MADNDSQITWLPSFERCLVQGSADPFLINHLDDILVWWSKRDVHRGQASLQLFEEFLDQLLIANPDNYLNLFPSSLGAARAKTRYRQLIGLFHPDRGTKPTPWLSHRAERINASYSGYCHPRRSLEEGGSRCDDGVRFYAHSNTNVNSASNSFDDSGLKRKPSGMSKMQGKHVLSRRPWFSHTKINSRKIRFWLGSAEKFEKQAFLGLIGLALFVALFLLLSLFLS